MPKLTLKIDDAWGEFASMEDVENCYVALANAFEEYGTGDYFFVKEVEEDE